jgi:hypothetical protein
MKNLSKLFFLLFLLGGMGLLSLGCLQKPAGINALGILKLQFSLMEGEIHSQAYAGDIRKLSIRLARKNDGISRETQVDFTGNNQQVEMPSLYPGDWQVTVSGLDDSGSVIFQGSGTALIQPDQITAIQIDLIPAPGHLDVTCDVSQISGLGANIGGTLYVYLNPEDSATKYYPLIRDGNLVKGTVSIPEGTFVVKIAVPNVSSKLFVSPYYTVNIKAGKTVYLTISANGGINIAGTINSTPSTPCGLIAAYNSQTSSVLLTWLGVSDPDLAGYYLYRSNSEGRMIRFANVNKGTNTYTSKVTAGDFYHNEIKYAVSSFDLGGVESFWSEMAYVKQ